MMDEADTLFEHVLEAPIEWKARASGEVVERIESLRFRTPTAADMLAIGANPVILDMGADPPVPRHDVRAMTQMMARLSGHEASKLQKMATKDWTACAWGLTPSFIPRVGSI